MITDQEMVEEKIIADLEDVEDDEPNSAIKEWALKCHDILDRMQMDSERALTQLKIMVAELESDLDDGHDCGLDTPDGSCDHPSHNQI